MKHNPNATANALAVTGGVVYTFCRIAISLFPDQSLSIAQSWFHGVALSPTGTWGLSLWGFVIGLVTFVTFSWVVGYIFASTYNYFQPTSNR